MKKLFTILLSAISFLGFAQQLPGVLVDYCVFNTPQNKPYLELYMAIVGNTVEYKNVGDNNFQAEVNVTVAIKQGESILYADRFRLKSQIISENSVEIPNFMDVQRIPVPNGAYVLELEVLDPNSAEKVAAKGAFNFEINFSTSTVAFSDIELIEKYSPSEKASDLTKGSFDLIPRIPYGEHYFGGPEEQLSFYTELYNTQTVLGSGTEYLVKYFISNSEGVFINQFSKFEKKTSSEVAVFFKSFNLKTLPTGNYFFNIEALNREGELIAAQKIPFVRYNPNQNLNIQNVDEITLSQGTFVDIYDSLPVLQEHIQSLYPISSVSERQWAENVIASKDLVKMQKFFYGFWANRDAYAPEKKWREYEAQVQLVQREFGTKIKKGYMSDRGRVYLQYGPPNDRDMRPHEPSAYPFEIWQYYDMKQNNQRNAIFVFVNRDLSTNDYQLMHSTAQGEIFNERWQVELYSRDTQYNNFDVTTPIDHFGGSIDRNSIINRRP
jgi:GWxTD domain-containing protein